MANGVSRRSVYEALKAATTDGTLDLWRLAFHLADDVESWGEDDFFSEQPSNEDDGTPPPPRYWFVTERIK